jgi:6-phosphogluconolactonase
MRKREIMPPTKENKPNIQILSDAEALARRCFELFVSSVEQTVREKDIFYFAISGGNSPRRFFELLGSEKISLSLPWDKIHLFWVDERYVPHDSPKSNYKLATDTFLSKVQIPKKNIHPIPTDFEDLDSAARQYEQIIQSVFNIKSDRLPEFDFITLGMGRDGHTGSLFPNTNFSFDTKSIACAVRLKKPAISRITLTPAVICGASQIAVLVSGEQKAKTLKEVLAGSPDEKRYPIYVLWPVLDKVLWLVDSGAAKLL